MHRYTVEDNLRDGYTYAVGICTTAESSIEANGLPNSTAAIQVHKKQDPPADHPPKHVIGSFEQAQIMSGSTF